MTEETKIKQQIKAYLDLKGVMWWYNLAGIGAKKGLPDLFALKDGTLYGIEVKTQTGRLSVHQERFLEELKVEKAVPIVARRLEDVMYYL